MGMLSWIFTVHETLDRRVLILFFRALQLNCEHTKHHIRICVFSFHQRGFQSCTGIPRFTLLMWGHIKKPRKTEKLCKSRLEF